MRKRGILRSARNYDPNEVSRETATSFDGHVDLAVQSEKDNCDINVIVKRFNVTGQLNASARMPTFGDFSGITDYHSAMTAVRQSQESFMTLPSGVRKRFGNDPQAFMKFASNPKNIDALRDMGLARKKDPVIIPPSPAKPASDGVTRHDNGPDEGNSPRGVVKDPKAAPNPA